MGCSWGATGLAGAAILHGRRGSSEPGELLPRLYPRVRLLLLLGCLAIAAASVGLRVSALDRALLPRLDGRVAVVDGKVASDPSPAGRATQFLLRADIVDGSRVREVLSVRAFGSLASMRFGDRVRVEAKIRPLELDARWDRRLYRRGVVAEATAGAEQIHLVRRSRNPLVVASNGLRRKMSDLATRSLGRNDAGLLLGLTIGDERLISPEVRDDFLTTSLSHLTAVSGANVAMVLGAVILVMRALRTSRRSQVITGLLTIGFFAIVTRGEPSVLRASVMAALALSAFLFGRRHDPLHGLVLAFTGLLAFDPFLLWSIGFQLSFAAALGILVLTPRILDRLGRLPRPLAEALAVGVGAQAAVFPLLAFHFEKISIVAVPANLAAFGLVAPITILGFAGGIFGAIWEPPGRFLLELAGPFVGLLRRLAHFFAAIPGSSVEVDDLGAPRVVALYLIVAGSALFLFVRRGIARYPVTIAVVVWLVAGVVPTAGSSAPPGLRATFFDVGQGDAALVESPGGARILIDGGPDSEVLANALSRRGIKRIDLVAFSHAHFDHVNGLAEVLQTFQVRKTIDPGIPHPLLRRVLKGTSSEPATDGDRFLIGDVIVDVLGPDPPLRGLAIEELQQSAINEGSSLNDASLVLRIGWASSCALFTGDIEQLSQQFLLERHRSGLECAVLKAPHHGSARIEDEFVDEVDAEVVVVSVGPNEYGHPTRTALSMFERSGARVVRTDYLEDIIVGISRAGRVSVE